MRGRLRRERIAPITRRTRLFALRRHLGTPGGLALTRLGLQRLLGLKDPRQPAPPTPQLLRQLIATPVSVVEHHPGIYRARYAPAPRRERTLPRVLFGGARFAGKGGEDLLAALAPKLGESLELDLVTTAPVPERSGVRVHRLEPSNPRLIDLYQQTDLFCLPTYGDAAPWAVVEAMACGAPVVSTPVGGSPISSMLAERERSCHSASAASLRKRWTSCSRIGSDGSRWRHERESAASSVTTRGVKLR